MSIAASMASVTVRASIAACRVRCGISPVRRRTRQATASSGGVRPWGIRGQQILYMNSPTAKRLVAL